MMEKLTEDEEKQILEMGVILKTMRHDEPMQVYWSNGQGRVWFEKRLPMEGVPIHPVSMQGIAQHVRVGQVKLGQAMAAIGLIYLLIVFVLIHLYAN